MDSSWSNLERELYFLIAKFLEDGPCQGAAKALRQELYLNQILPLRTDWMGQGHTKTFQEMVSAEGYGHIVPNFLLKICSRAGPLLDLTTPTDVKGIRSLLGNGKHSLLRVSKEFNKKRTVAREAACWHGIPLLAPINRKFSSFRSDFRLQVYVAEMMRTLKNLVHVTTARSWSGTSSNRHVTENCDLFSKVCMRKRILGHLASVYCVLFDRTGRLIATGADDHLVKLWSSFDGRLIATLRGHFAEIADMAINHENTLIAAGSCDKIIRVWSLITTAPVAVLQGHTGMITTLEFCPSVQGESRYLMSTGGDCTVCFWKFDIKTNNFESEPIKFNEKSRPGAQMLCSSFSPGGSFLVTGSSDNVIRIYQTLPGPPERIAELTGHSDHVDSIQFSNGGDRFASGSRDGSAIIWRYQRSEWKCVVVSAYQKPKDFPLPAMDEDTKNLKLKVTMIGWNLNDQFLVTAVTDQTLKVWDTNTGELIHVLVGHTDEVFVLECHPTEPSVFLSGGHDGNIILWNLHQGVMIKSFFNLRNRVKGRAIVFYMTKLEGQGHGGIFDCRFSPDGLHFAASDSHGHLCFFGFGSEEPFNKVPYEQFFHTDYRPLIRDANGYVLDEQTQMAPHLMAPPFLVDVDGNPHSPEVQLLIPGRNVNNLPQRRIQSRSPRPDLPPLLAEIIAAEQGAAGGENNLLSPPPGRPPGSDGRSPLQSPSNRDGGGGGGVGLRESGNVEGVRLANSNSYISQDISDADQTAWRKRRIVPERSSHTVQQDLEYRTLLGKEEVQRYFREKKRRAVSASQKLQTKMREPEKMNLRKKAKPKKIARAAPRVRSSYQVRSEMVARPPSEDEFVNVDVISSESDLDDDWESDSSESSEYSDWTEEVGLKEQREARKRRVRKIMSSEDEEEEEEEEEKEKEKEEEHKAEEVAAPSTSKPKKEKPPPKKAKKKKKEPKRPALKDKEEMLTFYQPPEWITSVKPRKSPYYPQVGDEVYYFRQGHQLYVQAVNNQKLYDVNPKKQSYSKLDLKAEELCRVVSLHYSGIPRLCSLKLAIISPESGANTGGSFSVKYHDMPDVIDFLVLRQHYDQGLQHNWKPEERFRCAIDDCWWAGTITGRSPHNAEFPESHFQCFEVRWDTNEDDRLSPWDMEALPENDAGNFQDNIPLTEEDQELFDYTANENDWPHEDRDEAIERVSSGLEQFCELPIAGAFAYPVDVEQYPDYWAVISFPTDLSMIRQRLANRFYRRRNALLWEIRLIERNTKLYNEEGSEIALNAGLITKVLIKFISDPNCRDLLALYNQYTERDEEELEEDGSGDDEGSKKKGSKKKLKNKRMKCSSSTAGASSPVQSWTSVARELLDFLISREDSEPFREPVDLEQYTDYLEFVREPMDFGTVRHRLENSLYCDPEAFARDIRLIFTNSRRYNTNPRSKIYIMNLRLSALFEDRIDYLLRNWQYDKPGKSNERWTRRKTQQLFSEHLTSPDLSSNEPSNSGADSSSRAPLRFIFRRDSDDNRVFSAAASPSYPSQHPSSSQEFPNGRVPSSSDEGGSSNSASRLTATVSHHQTRTNVRPAQDVRTKKETSQADHSSTSRQGCTSRASVSRTNKSNNATSRNVKSKKAASRSNVKSDKTTSQNNSLRTKNSSKIVENGHGRSRTGSKLKTKVVEQEESNESSEEESDEESEEEEEEEEIEAETDDQDEDEEQKDQEEDKDETDEEEQQNTRLRRSRGNRSKKRKTYKEVSEESGEESDSSAEEVSESEEEVNGLDKGDSEEDENDDADDDKDQDSESESDDEVVQRSSQRSRTEVVNRNSRKRRTQTSSNSESDGSPEPTKNKRRRLSSSTTGLKSRRSGRTHSKVNYAETEEDEGTNIIGVSSRGRVRRAASRYADYVD